MPQSPLKPVHYCCHFLCILICQKLCIVIYRLQVSAYGYMGLFFLNQKGKRIKKNDKNLMDHIGLLDIQLNTCYGCLIGVTDQFKDGLSAKKLKNSYKAFKQLGWLK